jgi:hypothetical protein
MANQEKKAGDPTGSFPLLNQLIIAMEDAEIKLEDAYSKGNAEQLNSAKNLILQIQKKIAEEIK